MPVLVVPVSSNDAEQPTIITGFTRDLSTSGMALLTNQPLLSSDLIVVIGDCDGRTIMDATCCHSVHKGYGCFQSGIRLNKVLKDGDYLPLIEYVHAIEAMQEG